MDMLIKHLNDIHTKPMGYDRITRNLQLETDALEWCKNAVVNANNIQLLNKNYYVYYCGAVITINAKSFTIITAHKVSPRIREIKNSEYPILEKFLYHAIFVPEGAEIPPRNIIFNPEIYIYIDKFGENNTDTCVVAEQNGQIVGAAWARIISAYGHINNNTPELAISVLPDFRGMSVGSKLMQRLFNLLKDKGCNNLSLSVQKENKAVGFYKRLGFNIIDEKSVEYIMLKTL